MCYVVLCYHHVDNLELVCCIDVDLGGCIDDSMSTNGYIFLLCDGVVSWRSKKQTTRAVSTMESEYIGCFEAIEQCNWMKNLIYEMEIVRRIEKPIKLYCDNTTAVFFAKKNKRSEASRLMDIKYLKVQDKVREGVIDIQHISTHDMVANPLTKALNVTVFNKHVLIMGFQSALMFFKCGSNLHMYLSCKSCE